LKEESEEKQQKNNNNYSSTNYQTQMTQLTLKQLNCLSIFHQDSQVKSQPNVCDLVDKTITRLNISKTRYC